MSTNRVPISINTATSGPGSGNRPSTTPVADASHRIRILIADDHLLFRDGVRKLLSAVPDFNVVAEAGHGDEVLEMTARHQPDVVLLDLSMPGQDGLITLQRLRSAHPEVKVILLTSSEERDEMLQAVRFGTAGIVQRSTPRELLIKSIRKIHAGEMSLDPNTCPELIHQFASKNEMLKRIAGRERDSNSLSIREREIVALVAQGYKNKAMAEKMFISEQTVKNHLHNIFDKLGVSDRLELALYAIHKGLHLAGDAVAR